MIYQVRDYHLSGPLVWMAFYQLKLSNNRRLIYEKVITLGWSY